LVNFDKKELFLKYILDLMNNKKLRLEMSKEARKNALNFKWSNIIEKVKKVYEELSK